MVLKEAGIVALNLHRASTGFSPWYYCGDPILVRQRRVFPQKAQSCLEAGLHCILMQVLRLTTVCGRRSAGKYFQLYWLRLDYLQKLPMPMLDKAKQRSARPWPICGTEAAREIAFATSPGL